MNLFWKKKVPFEKLPPQISGNELIERWHRKQDGQLDRLIVDGTAKSRESEKRLGRYIGVSLLVSLIAAFFMGGLLSPTPDGRGAVVFWTFILLFGPLCWASYKGARDRRICTVTKDELQIEYLGQQQNFPLTQIVGVRLHSVDRQRIHEEQKAKRREADPKLIEPFSMDVSLETVLGNVELGSIYGLQDAQNITNAINCAITFMKGRSHTGKGTVVDPQFQYRQKVAGGIPA